jgi:hypothetical protein
MPITVKVVTEKEYQAWLAKTKEAQADVKSDSKFAAAQAATKARKEARAEDKPAPAAPATSIAAGAESAGRELASAGGHPKLQPVSGQLASAAN